MIDPLLIYFEFWNGFIWPLGVCVLAIFVWYIATESVSMFKTYGWPGLLLIRARGRAAVSIMIMIIGVLIHSYWSWLVRWMDRAGFGGGRLDHELSSVILSVGFAVSGVGMLCMIRVFSPDDWGKYAWVWCLLISAAVALGLLAWPSIWGAMS